MSGMNLIHVAEGGDFTLIFWGIVIAIFIVTQIVKSRKKFDESAPQQGKPAASGGDPAEELRKFLEGLGQAQPPQPPPAPVASSRPPPHPARRVATHHVKARLAMPPPVREERVLPVFAVPVPEAAMPDDAAVLARYKAEMAAAVAPPHAGSKWRAILVSELRSADRQPARKGLVMREIFGAPTALRRREVVYPLV